MAGQISHLITGQTHPDGRDKSTQIILRFTTCLPRRISCAAHLRTFSRPNMTAG